MTSTDTAMIEARSLDKKYDFFITLNDNINTEVAKGKITASATKDKSLHDQQIAVKDSICTQGLRTTAGSKILNNYIPVFNATVVEKINQAGANIVGKTAMDEFGFGTFSVNCAYKIPKNPHDPNRSCGGSSGGAAGYVAASQISRMGIAQSTGGSISCPASFCGVVGITPTYGVVSRYGLIDYANSLDKIGTVGKTVKDAETLFKVIAGYDPNDSTSIDISTQKLGKTLMDKNTASANRGKTTTGAARKKIKVALPKEYFKAASKGVLKEVWNTIHKLESENIIEYKDISLPNTKYALSAYYITALTEASTNLAKFCGLRYGISVNPENKGFNEYFSEIRTGGFGQEAKQRILLGTFARLAGYRDHYYLQALKIRTLIIQEFKQAFNQFDTILAPTMPFISPKFSEIEKFTPLQHYQSDVLTVPINLAGMPHVSIPCGKSKKMPVGLHILGDQFTDFNIIDLAKRFEQAGVSL